ncbi:MAG: hypothetical protein WBQ85_18130 [Candidatus Sulfotelmatobacter sp.]
MADNTNNALQLLEDFRRERDELNLVIKALERRLGIIPAVTDSETANPESSPRVTVSIDNIPVGFFHNMSQSAAAEKLLRMNPGHPLTTNEILEAFKKSGIATGKNAVTILYTALKRGNKFERVAGKAWGLAEWYPQKKRQKEEPVVVLDDDDEIAAHALK